MVMFVRGGYCFYFGMFLVCFFSRNYILLVFVCFSGKVVEVWLCPAGLLLMRGSLRGVRGCIVHLGG